MTGRDVLSNQLFMLNATPYEVETIDFDLKWLRAYSGIMHDYLLNWNWNNEENCTVLRWKAVTFGA